MIRKSMIKQVPREILVHALTTVMLETVKH